MQRIRTALRTSGGRFFYEGEGVEGREGAVEGAADVGGDELQADGAEDVPEALGRTGRAMPEDLVEIAQSVLDPLDRRGAEDLLAAALQSVHLFAERVDAPLRFDHCLGECLAAASLADEVDEVREPALFCGEFCLLQLERVWKI